MNLDLVPLVCFNLASLGLKLQLLPKAPNETIVPFQNNPQHHILQFCQQREECINRDLELLPSHQSVAP